MTIAPTQPLTIGQYLQQAIAHHQAGRLQDAELLYRAILQIQPDHPDAICNLEALAMQGKLVALFAERRIAEATALAQTMTERFPLNGFGWVMLGALFRQAGQRAEALAFTQKGVALLPNYAAAHYNLGIIFAELNHQGEAEASFRRALQIKTDFAEAHNNLGNILKMLGRLDEAENSYRQALRIRPDFAEVHNNLGNFFNESGRLDEAENSYRQALHIRPDFAEAYNNLGTILDDMGGVNEARACYEHSIQIKPDYADAYGNLGNLFMALGRMDEAEASLRRALEIKPDLIKAEFGLAQIGKVRIGDENFAALIATEEAVRNGAKPLPDKDAILLHFALGKSYDDIGEYGKAFPHFLEGCKLKRATSGYDPDREARNFASIMRSFDASVLDELHGCGDSSRLPIFVLGMPRSGTTLVEQIIASHPDVHGAGELPDMMAIASRNIAGATFPDNVQFLDQIQLASWGAEYVAGLQRRAPDARHITDKMPGNFLALGLIHLMLPNAKIIHVSRNPVDTCLSCFTALFRRGHEYTYDLAELGRYYADYVHLMEYWRKILPGDTFLDVRYEDVVEDMERQARRMIEYCGLEWNDACTDFHRNKRVVNTASMAQVRQPIYTSSVERWRNYEQFVGPLLPLLELPQEPTACQRL